ncbi:acyl CoA:acetate/3-ketoacid CoA transferase [uncultured Clostridium sp.]|uniref:acyl CoA:acetate/3-ketoacid CoA transferase n=1 Tax=uncultured Clostridium sp. TaxID=59620 RepID=UPI0025E1FCBE|nr:CoA-transferase [uncultured Clostridium sp.]
MVKFIDSKEAAFLIKNNQVVAVSGFAGLSVPEELIKSLEERYENSKTPKNLTLMFAAAQGDGNTKGLNHLAHNGLVKKVIGGHFNLAPKLAKMMNQNIVEGFNFPQGVMCNIFRDIARKSKFTLSRIGIGTFVDPRIEGGKVNSITNQDLVELIKLNGEDFLLFHHLNINAAFIKGSYCDSYGNISLDYEATYSEAFIIAQAVKNCGGIVIVQVDRICSGEMKCRSIKIPGIYVDYVVVTSSNNENSQALGMKYNSMITAYHDIDGNENINLDRKNYNINSPENINIKRNFMSGQKTLNPRKIIGRRAACELKKGDIVNVGIGIPEEVSKAAEESGMHKYITLTVEAGPIGGVAQSGKLFGASLKPQCIIDQVNQFDFYDGGGLDTAFLGMAECDKCGNVNVSKFGNRLAGCGGFIDITQNTNKIVFCGTFVAKGFEMYMINGKVKIINNNRTIKFKKMVNQITFNGSIASDLGKDVIYVTERAVFKLLKGRLYLIEKAPGVDIQKDIIDLMDFEPVIDKNIKTMDQNLFV